MYDIYLAGDPKTMKLDFAKHTSLCGGGGETKSSGRQKNTTVKLILQKSHTVNQSAHLN